MRENTRCITGVAVAVESVLLLTGWGRLRGGGGDPVKVRVEWGGGGAVYQAVDCFAAPCNPLPFPKIRYVISFWCMILFCA